MELKSYPIVWFELVIIGLALVTGVGLTRAFLPILAYGLDPTGILVGFATSAFFFFRVFIELPSGLIATRVGRRNLIVASFLFGAGGSLTCAIAPNIYVLILGITIWGLGIAVFFLSSTSLLFDLFTAHDRGKGVGTFQSIEFIGLFLGAPIGALLAGHIGYQNIFLLASAIYFCTFVIVFFSEDLKEVDAKAERKLAASAFKEVLVGLGSWRLVAVSFMKLSLHLIRFGVLLTVFQLYLNTQLDMDVERIGVVMGAATGGIIIATFVSGQLTDKIGGRPLIITGLLTSGICLYLYTVATTFTEIIILAAIDGAGYGLAFVSLLVFLSNLVPPSIRSGAIGLYRTFMDIGGITGPIVFMMLYTSTGSHTPFWAASLLLLANVVIILLITPHTPREEKT